MTDDLDPLKLRELLDAVAALPRSVEPDRDAWPAIRDRIDAQRVRPMAPAGGLVERRARRAPWLVAAAALVVVSSGVTLLVLKGGAVTNVTTDLVPTSAPDVSPLPGRSNAPLDAPKAAVPPVAPHGEPQAMTVVSRAEDALFNRYDAAASDLAGALRQRRSMMDPATVAVIESCLARIDAAIVEARAALRRDPQSAGLAELLTVTYRQKLDLLKRAADLPARAL